jgi:tetratricopeptide (TPR) repeat protein
MRSSVALTALLLAGLLVAAARAGLYNSAEPPFPLNPGVEKFLDKLKDLRSYAPPDGRTMFVESDLRKDYLKKVEALREKQKATGRLSAEEAANLGAYLMRLRMTRVGGIDLQEAQDVLQAAAENYPRDFHVQANLATLHQLMGNLDLAERALERARELAPDQDSRRLEGYQLLLVRQRAGERPGREPSLDRLFPIRFVGESGQWEIGKIAAAEAAKISGGLPEAKRVVEQLLVWFPTDGRLHWLLGEIANAEGDVRGAFAAMHWAVNDARLSSADLRDHRSRLKLVVDERIAEQEAKAQADRERLANEMSGAASPPAGSALSDMTWRGWLIVGIGAAVTLLLLFLQIRETFRRRKRLQETSPRSGT